MLNTFLIDTWSFFKIHIVTILIIILPVTIPVELITALHQYFTAEDDVVFQNLIFPLLLNSMAYPIYTIAIIFYISSVISGNQKNIKTLWNLGIEYWLPFMIYSILSGIVITIGLVLFIIPGLLYTARYSFSAFDLLLNKNTPLNAMKNSWHETKDYIWIILGGYITITVFLFSPFFFISQLFTPDSTELLIFEIISNIILSVLHVLYTIFSFRVYEYAINKK